MPKKKEITPFEKSVYAACEKIPRGRVSTYAEIARSIGQTRSARAVGNALNKNPYAPASTRGNDRSPASTRIDIVSNRRESTRGGPQVPCHRVVRSDGLVGGYAWGGKKKIAMLKKEGLTIQNGRVADFEKVLYGFR